MAIAIVPRVQAGTDDVPLAFHQAQDLIEVGQPAKALEIARRLRASANDDNRLAGRALLSRLYLAEGQVESAGRELDPLLKNRQGPSELPSAVTVEVARYLVASKQPRSAAALFDQVVTQGSGLARVYAAEGMADAFLLQKDCPGALKWLDFSLKCLDDWMDQMARAAAQDLKPPSAPVQPRPASPVAAVQKKDAPASPFASLRQRLQAKRQHILDIQTILEHGLGFHFYRRAQTLRYGAKHEAALAAYDQLLDAAKRNRNNTDALHAFQDAALLDESLLAKLPVSPVYEEAARLYRCLCLLALARDAQAASGLDQFVNAAPHSPYAGEALRVLGDIALERAGDSGRAVDFYTRAVKWFDSIAQEVIEFDQYEVPGASTEITAPPRSARLVDAWGNLLWSAPAPEDVVNHLTCSWYLAQQKMLAQVARSLAYFIQGKTEQAIADLGIILETDEHDRRLTESGMPSNYRRLRDGYQAGRLYATTEELNLFQGVAKVALLRAEMNLEMERLDEAEAGYARLLAQMGDRIRLPQRAYLEYALASCHALRGQAEPARKLLEPFQDRYAQTPTWPRAMVLLADFAAKPEDRELLLRSVYKRAPSSEAGQAALLRAGQVAYTSKRYANAREAFTELAAAAKDSWMGKVARDYLALVEKADSSQ